MGYIKKVTHVRRRPRMGAFGDDASDLAAAGLTPAQCQDATQWDAHPMCQLIYPGLFPTPAATTPATATATTPATTTPATTPDLTASLGPWWKDSILNPANWGGTSTPTATGPATASAASAAGGSDPTTLLLIGGVLVAGYYLFGNKKRRK